MGLNEYGGGLLRRYSILLLALAVVWARGAAERGFMVGWRPSQHRLLEHPPSFALVLRGGEDAMQTGEGLSEVKKMVNKACLLWDDEGDDEGAEAELNKALDIDPKDPDALCSLGVLLHEAREDNENACQYFERALAASPEHVDSMHYWGNVLYTMKKDKEAEELYKKAMLAFAAAPDGSDQHPLLVPTLCNYGALLERVRGDLDGAERLYKMALEQNPEDSTALYNYAVLLEDGRNNDAGAKELYERALEVDEEDVNALNNLALMCQNKLGHYGEAQNLFERAVTAAPGRVDVLCNYGLFLEDVRGDMEGAMGAYQKALEEDEADVVALCSVGGVLLRQGEDAQAEAKFKQAVEIDGDGAEAIIQVRREAASQMPKEPKQEGEQQQSCF